METRRPSSKSCSGPAPKDETEILAGPSSDHVVVAIPTATKQRCLRARLRCFVAAKLVLKMTRPALVCGPLAWLLTYTFTLGNILSGKSPAQQSEVDIVSMASLISTSCHCLSLLVPYVLSMQNFSRLDGTPWTFSKLAVAFLKRTWWVYLATHVLVVGTTYAIVSAAGEIAAVFKTHFYLGCFWNSLFRAGVDEASRKVYQRETMAGTRCGHVNSAPYQRRFAQALSRATSFTVVAIVAAGLVHICSSLHLLEYKFASLQFSIASVALKAVILAITKRIALKRGGTHLRKIYVLTAVPTVLINTQVRLVLLRSGSSSPSARSFLELGLLEPLMRIAKVWHLRHAMNRLDNDHGQVMGAKLSASLPERGIRRLSTVFPSSSLSDRHRVRDPRPSRLIRRATVLDSRQSVLHFHAAESHADMCSEYIAIACSTSIYFFLRHHPHFGWHSQDASASTEWMDTLFAGSWQLGIELIVDFICCLFELANGIPLYASDRLGEFLTAVFTSCALASVSISTILCAHAHG
jgi:hypothetical protein